MWILSHRSKIFDENFGIDVVVTSELREAAIKVHQTILVSGQMAILGFWELGRSLKTMRDDKLYLALGYTSFEAYCKEELKVDRRFAYERIQISETFDRDTVRMCGQQFSKLRLLVRLSEGERKELLSEPQIIPSTGQAKAIKEMTVHELEQVKKALNDADEARAALEKAQVNLTEMEQKAKVAESSRSTLKEKLAKLYQDSNQEIVSELKKQLEKAQQIATEKEAESKKLRDAITGLESRLKELEAKKPQVVERVVEVEKIVEAESPELRKELEAVKQEVIEKEKALQELLEKQAKVKDFETQVNKLSGEIATLLETKRKLEEADNERERIKKRALEFHAALRRVMRPLQEEWGNLEFLLKQCNINAIDATEVLAYADQFRKIADTLEYHLSKVEGDFVTLSESGVPHLDRKSFEGVTVDVQPLRVGRA